MTDPWSERADLYRTSAVHAEGADLDLIVAWASGAKVALDVATGGGHVARRLREAGLDVVSCDPAPGMEPDVVCVAEQLPFAEASFDLVACRRAAHHFDDVAQAVGEMARVSRDLVVLQDAVYVSDEVELAERLRDPSHIAHHSEQEWRALFDDHGLEVEAVERFEERLDFASWFERTGCTGETAERVRALLADRSDVAGWTYPYVVLKGRRRR
jgi:ubiquinone/menaquinone biosynthesis C-methylase UbiE